MKCWLVFPYQVMLKPAYASQEKILAYKGRCTSCC